MKKLRLLAIVFLSIFAFNVHAYALSYNLSASSYNVYVGDKFTVSASVNAVASWSVVVKAGGPVSGCYINESDAPTGRNTSKTYSTTCTATGTGTITINLSGNVTPETDDFSTPISKSINVNVSNRPSSGNGGGDGSRGNSPSTKYNNGNSKSNSSNNTLSDNNKLKSLSVENGKLSPKFDKNTKEYTVEVDDSVEKIKINAEAEDENAKIEGLGEKEIKEATSFQIAVTAENGKVNTYTLKISYKDEHPITVKIGKKTYTVVKRKSLLKEFDDYKFTMIKINGIEVPALYNKTTKLTLVGLTDGDKVYLYRYDKKNNTYVKYIEYDFKNVKLVLFDLEKKMIPSGYEKYTIKINDYNTKVYKLRKSSKYSLIYGMNVKTGAKSLYLHDSKENTVQRYTTEASEKLERENDKYYKMCIALCGGIALLIILLLIVITMKDKTKKKAMKIKKKLDNEDKKEKISKE